MTDLPVADAATSPGAPVMGEPDGTGRFGGFGGQFVPESLMPALQELDGRFREAWADPAFRAELDGLLADYAGRPSPLTECHRLSGELGVRILFKREDLNHTGSHKINNVLGQALLARRMGKSRLVAETGAGQHGVATATAAALLGMECLVYMGEVDMARQELNVFRMRLLGAEVTPALSGSRTLKDAVNEAMRDWVATVEHSHYCLGSVMGPHPYPWMVREFHRVIGVEARAQCRDLLDGRPARRGGGLRGGRLQRGGHLLRLRRGARGGAGGRGAGRRRRGGPRRARHRARHEELPAAGRVRPGPGGRTRSRPGSTTRASGPSTAHLADCGRARYEAGVGPEVIDAFVLSPAWRASSRPWSRPTPWPGCPGNAVPWRVARCW